MTETAKRTKHNKFYERRCRRFVITNRTLAAIFNGCVKIEGESLPADAEVGHVYVDYPRNSIVAVVYSDEYSTVEELQEIPEIGGPLGLRMHQFPKPDTD